jgi:hypothetical protein
MRRKLIFPEARRRFPDVEVSFCRRRFPDVEVSFCRRRFPDVEVSFCRRRFPDVEVSFCHRFPDVEVSFCGSVAEGFSYRQETRKLPFPHRSSLEFRLTSREQCASCTASEAFQVAGQCVPATQGPGTSREKRI